jgi:hypothetical protein
MASRIVLGIVIIVLLGATAFFVFNYKIETHYENGKMDYMKIVPRGGSADTPVPASNPEPQANNNLPPSSGRATFRIATYNLSGLDEAKIANPRVMEILAQLLGRFDVIALEGMRGKTQGVPVRLIEQLNATSGRQFDFVTCPTQRRDGIEHYSGFFFDKTVVEVDRATVHFVEDPSRYFRHKPLVGLFRARANPLPFTFYLVAVDTDPERPAAELDRLADVYRSVREFVRGNGPTEDDVIVLGNFEADEQHLGRLGKVAGITAAIGNAFPTTVRGTKMSDNLLFDRRATVEFTSRAEVVDLMREFNLTIQAASELSEHLPLWGEFSVYEGGPRGYVPKGQ